jgi:hypothetical protein
MNATPNGRQRKTLAAQLDRLDAILDALSEGLNEAVAMVVQQSVTSAVQAAVAEVLTNPDLQRRLREVHRPDPVPARRWWDRLKGAVAAACASAAGWVRRAWSRTSRASLAVTDAGREKVAAACRTARSALRGAWSRTAAALGAACRLRKALLSALAAGLALGVGAYLLGPVASSLVSGAAGFTAAMAAGTWRTLAGLLAGDDPPGA